MLYKFSFIAYLFLFGGMPVNVAAQGNCGTQLKDISVHDGSSITIYNTACTGETAKLNVQYAWVNMNAASLVLSGFMPQELIPLFGEDPSIVDTSVGRHVVTILERYGIGLSNEIVDTTYNRYVPQSLATQIFSTSKEHNINFDWTTRQQLSEASLTNSRLRYLPLENFPWPKTSVVEQFLSGSSWPKGNYTYQVPWDRRLSDLRSSLLQNNEYATPAVDTLLCVQYYSFIHRREFDSYWNIAEEATLLIENETYSNDSIFALGESIDRVVAGHPSYDALNYFGQHNWPNDFLVSLGNYHSGDECMGSSSGFSLSAMPRTPFVLFAIISSENDPVTVKGLSFLVDESEDLRLTPEPSVHKSIDFASQIRINKVQPLIVPLNIELRYDLQAQPLRGIVGNGKFPNDVLETLRRFSPQSVGLELNNSTENRPDNWNFSKRVDSLPNPTVQNIARRYIFGEALELVNVDLEREQVAVKSAPAFAVLTNYFWEFGSCPFVTFLNAEGHKISRKRVLIGASSDDRALTETLIIPMSATHMLIEEIEPEIAFLSNISSISAEQNMNTLADNIILRPEEGIKIELPPEAEQISISGYYQPL